jgi:hypothetical protein
MIFHPDWCNAHPNVVPRSSTEIPPRDSGNE